MKKTAIPVDKYSKSLSFLILLGNEDSNTKINFCKSNLKLSL